MVFKEFNREVKLSTLGENLKKYEKQIETIQDSQSIPEVKNVSSTPSENYVMCAVKNGSSKNSKGRISPTLSPFVKGKSYYYQKRPDGKGYSKYIDGTTEVFVQSPIRTPTPVDSPMQSPVHSPVHSPVQSQNKERR